MALENNWRYKSIQNLEKIDYGDPSVAPTNMVKRCLKLCRVPLDEFSVEALRLMIGQKFALRFLIPLAIEQLRKDIFCEGDCYSGDLLQAVLSIDPSFCNANQHYWKEINELIKDKRKEIEAEKISTSAFDNALVKG